MSDADDWELYPIPPLGLAIERYVPWPAALAELTDGANFYQRIPDTDGLVFLRYGPSETPERFLTTLTDAVRSYEILENRPTEVLGGPAIRLMIMQTRAELGVYRSDTPGALPIHETHPAQTIRIEILGFTTNGVPVLVGFRLEVDRLTEHRARIDRIVGSISRLPESPDQSLPGSGHSGHDG